MSFVSDVNSALEKNDETRLNQIIKEMTENLDSADVNQVLQLIGMYGYSGWTERYKNQVDLILKKGFTPNLSTCALLLLDELADALLQDDPESIHTADASGQTPLHHAAERGNLRLAKLLIELGADVNALDHREESPILHALHAGPWKQTPAMDVVSVLLEAGAEIDLWTAAAMGDCERIEATLEENPEAVNEWNNDGRTALFFASRNDHVPAVKLLLSLGAEINKANEDQQSALSTATLHALSGESSPELIATLLDAGATMTLETAIVCDKLDLVKEFVTADPSLLDAEGATSPHGYAIHVWRPNVLKYLVSQGSQLSESDWEDIRTISGNDQALISELEALIKDDP